MCLFASAEMKLQKKYPVMEEFGIFPDLLKLQALFQCPWKTHLKTWILSSELHLHDFK
jgi:hypothetical protein